MKQQQLQRNLNFRYNTVFSMKDNEQSHTSNGIIIYKRKSSYELLGLMQQEHDRLYDDILIITSFTFRISKGSLFGQTFRYKDICISCEVALDVTGNLQLELQFHVCK